jgi:phage terminase small subunit
MNPKQKRFCQEYCKDLNGTQAAIRAGYSPKTAESQASRLLRNDKVSSEIAKLLGTATDKASITLDAVICELQAFMLADISEIASWQGNTVTMKASSELSPDALKAIESVSTTSSKTGEPQLRVKLHSKLKAAELLIRVFELQETERRLAELEGKLNEIQKPA